VSDPGIVVVASFATSSTFAFSNTSTSGTSVAEAYNICGKKRKLIKNRRITLNDFMIQV
jgi:hypothetical protein